MPATGVSGLDLYVKTESGWRWLAVGQPERTKDNTAVLVKGLPPGRREYLLYLPLYNGVSSVEIGVPGESTLEKGPARAEGRRKPIVFYGTSITQGGCASRPGMVHTAILGRRLDRPVINLGFSGNGLMEPELAALLAELDPAVYVLDCLPNMTAKLVSERVEPFVRTLRKAHPTTPIVLAEDRTYTNAPIVPAQRERNATSRAELKAAYDRLKADGVGNLHYLPGETQLGEDGEDTVDGSHPTDLGFSPHGRRLRERCWLRSSTPRPGRNEQEGPRSSRGPSSTESVRRPTDRSLLADLPDHGRRSRDLVAGQRLASAAQALGEERLGAGVEVDAVLGPGEAVALVRVEDVGRPGRRSSRWRRRSARTRPA